MNKWEGKQVHIDSLSGGRSSRYQGFLLEGLAKKNNWHLEHVFMDTGAEHPATYQFLLDMHEKWGWDITCIRAVTHEFGTGNTHEVLSIKELKQDYKAYIDHCVKYNVPSIATPNCTERMKTFPFVDYCKGKYGKNGYKRWIGYRADEPKRMKEVEDQIEMFMLDKKTKARRNSHKGFGYLAHISDFDKQDITEWSAKQSFDLPYRFDHLGNCVFCVKKDPQKIALAARDEPEMAIQFIEVIENDDNRVLPSSPYDKNIQYRGHHSLASIMNTYADVPTEVLRDNVYRGRKLKAEPKCATSCIGVDVQYEMFT